MLTEAFVPFLLRAKQNTYASGNTPAFSSRPASHDFHYEEVPYLYIDTYMGGHHFIGEETVWENGASIWGMNYYGKMWVEIIPNGFGSFLKSALKQVPQTAPFRGPEQFTCGDFEYRCSWKGELAVFYGEEEILLNGIRIYHLLFHGGEIQE